jgi:hypothetical protein
MSHATRGDEVAIRIGAYCGAEGEEEPRTVEIRGLSLPVDEILERWREPRGRYFRVLLGDGSVHLLLCRAEDLSWWRVLERGRQRLRREAEPLSAKRIHRGAKRVHRA